MWKAQSVIWKTSKPQPVNVYVTIMLSMCAIFIYFTLDFATYPCQTCFVGFPSVDPRL